MAYFIKNQFFDERLNIGDERLKSWGEIFSGASVFWMNKSFVGWLYCNLAKRTHASKFSQT